MFEVTNIFCAEYYINPQDFIAWEEVNLWEQLNQIEFVLKGLFYLLELNIEALDTA